MLDEPTQLVIPQSEMIGTPNGSMDLMSTSFYIFGFIALGACVWFIYRKKHGVDQRELAFRSICRRLGLSRNEITTIRNHASAMGMTTPVGIVMSPELMNQVLDGSAS